MSDRSQPYKWVPPSIRGEAYGAHSSTVKSAMDKTKDFAKKYKWVLMIGGGILLALIAWHLWSRNRSASLVRQQNTARRGIVSGESSMSSKVGSRLRGASGTPAIRTAATRLRGAEVASTDAKATAPTAAAAPKTEMVGQVTGVGQLCSQNLPKPMNMFEDNLVGAGDITVGPGVAPFVGAGAGVPVDFAGSCSGVNPAAVWQSTQLLPSNCGQSLEGTSDWDIYAPSNAALTSFIGWQQLGGQDTVLTTNKNASLDLRPEPQVTTGCFQAPWGQSSWVQDAPMKTDWSHSLVA